MKIVIFKKSGGKKTGSIKSNGLVAFKSGIENISENEAVYYNNINTINCDICVMLSFFNKYKKLQGIAKMREIIYNNNKTKKWIFLEANPLARYYEKENIEEHYFRICLNSVYHRECKYLDLNLDKNRWNKISNECNIKVEPWRKNGEHILIIMNSTNLYSMEDNDLYKWINNKIEEIRNNNCKRKIIIRSKDIELKNIKKEKNKLIFKLKNENKIIYDKLGNIDLSNSNKNELEKDLQNAWVSVLFSTTASVISLIKGIPVFCESYNTIGYEICNTDFTKIENPKMLDRTDFFNKFAHQIWSIKELNKGIVWEKYEEYLANLEYNNLINNFLI